jgi:hypothetical protein
VAATTAQERRRKLAQSMDLPKPPSPGLGRRALADMGLLLRHGPGALAQMTAAPVKDTWQILEGVGTFGNRGFFKDLETGGYKAPSITSDLVLPFAESFATTGRRLGRDLNPVAFAARAAFGDLEGARADLHTSLAEYNEHPLLSTVEDVGNIALAGYAVSKPLGAAGNRAAASSKAALAQGDNATAARLAARAERLSKASEVSREVVSRPYRATARRALDAPILGGRMPVGPEGGRLADLSIRQFSQQLRHPEGFAQIHPTVQAARSNIDALKGSKLGQRAESYFGRDVRAARAIPRNLLEQIGETRNAITAQYAPDLRQVALRKGLETIKDDLAAAGVKIPEGRKFSEMAPDDILHLAREADAKGLKVPGTRDLQRQIAMLDMYELARGIRPGALTDLLLHKAELGQLFDPLQQGLHKARELGVSDDLIREALGGGRFITDVDAPILSQLDPLGQSLVGDAISSYKNLLRRHNETRLAGRGEAAAPGTMAVEQITGETVRGSLRAFPNLRATRNYRDKLQAYNRALNEGLPLAERARLAENLRSARKKAERYDPQHRALEAHQLAPVQQVAPKARTSATMRSHQDRIAKAGARVEALSRGLDERQIAARAGMAGKLRELRGRYDQLMRDFRKQSDPVEASQTLRKLEEVVDELGAFARDNAQFTRPRARVAQAEAAVLQKASEFFEGLANYDPMKFTPESLARVAAAVERLGQIEGFIETYGPVLAQMKASTPTSGLNSVAAWMAKNPNLSSPAWRQLFSEVAVIPNVKRFKSVLSPAQAQRAIDLGRKRVEKAVGGLEQVWDPIRALDDLERSMGTHARRLEGYEHSVIRESTRAQEALNAFGREARKIDTLERRAQRYADDVANRIESAPAIARPALQLTREGLPALRELLIDAGADASVVRALDIEGLPTTVRALEDMGIDMSYVSNMPMDRSASAGLAPAVQLRTSTPGRFRRREGTNQDLNRTVAETLPQQQAMLAAHYMKEEALSVFAREHTFTPEQILQQLGHQGDDVAALLRDRPGLERTMAEAGYVQYNPDALFPFRTRRTTSEGQWVKENVALALKRGFETGMVENFMRAFVDPVTSAWKGSVLALRPAWYVYNTVGNVMMARVEGVTFREMARYVPEAIRAQREFAKGLPTGHRGIDRAAQPEVFQRGMMRSEYLRAQQDFGRVGQAVSQMPSVQRLGSTPGASLVGRGVGKVGALTQAGFRLNSFLDNVSRATVYMARRGQGVGKQNALQMMNKTIGEYHKLTHFEKTVLRRSFPFYTWMRHISKLTLRQLKPNNIDRFVLMANITRILGEPNEIESMLPEYAYGDVHLGQRANGEDMFLATRGLNPFSDVVGPLMQEGDFSARGVMQAANPLATIPFEQATGFSTFTGRPFTTPYPKTDSLGREMPTAPPLSEQMIQSIPQAKLARDLWRAGTGDTMSRYGTGEPVLMGESPPVYSKLTQAMGFPIRPLNVQSMQAQAQRREDQARRQRARYLSQLEMHQQQVQPLPGMQLLPGK